MLKNLSKTLLRINSKESNHSTDVALSFSETIVRIGRATKTGKLHANEDRCTVLETMNDFLDEEVVTVSEMLEFDLKPDTADLLEKTLYVGVFDGHGGSGCSTFVARNLHTKISKSIEAAEVSDLLDVKLIPAIQKAFADCESDFESYSLKPLDTSGSCAAVALICDRDVVVAHSGDCRVVIRSCGETICNTRDHRVEYPEEEARIKSLGGVVLEGRLNGVLSPARGFGDFDIKSVVPKGVLVCTPDVCRHAIDLGPVGKFNSFMVIATDGLWDVMETNDVMNFVEKVFRKTGSADVAAQRLVESASRNNHDDVTVVVIAWQRVLVKPEGNTSRVNSKDEDENGDNEILSPQPTRKKFTPDAKS